MFKEFFNIKTEAKLQDAIDKYRELVDAGRFKSVVLAQENHKEEIEKIWEQVKEALEGQDLKVTEELREIFSQKLDRWWGLKNVGPDY